jgi:hypothetical protein
MDTLATAPAETGHVLVIERVFDAPPALVFRLWSDPARVKEWWHPKDFVTPTFEMDFREGGAYRYSIRSAKNHGWAHGIYREIEDSVAMFAQRNRIGLVLRYTGDEMKPDDRASVLQGVNKPVVYQDRLDITQHILNQLNAGATMPAGGGVGPPAPGAAGSQIPAGTQNAQRQPPVIPQRPGNPTPR